MTTTGGTRSGPATLRRHEVDVVVYGGTPAGVATSVRAAREGLDVVLVEPSGHLGGATSSGLATAEFEHMLPECYSGFGLEVYTEVGRRYGFDEPLFHWEPRVIEQVYLELAATSGVVTRTGETLAAVTAEDGRIRMLATDSGDVYAGGIYVDCSYEGDLMAAAGVSSVVGRDDQATYGESLAGVTFVEDPSEVAEYHDERTVDAIVPVSPYHDGVLLPGFVEPDAVPPPRRADRTTMNYHYRVTLSTAGDRVPVPPPDGYDPVSFRPYADLLRRSPGARVRDLIDISSHASGRYRPVANGRTRSLPGEKWEANNRQDRVLSLGHVGGQVGYPDAAPHERARYWDDHRRHNQGLLYFLATDDAVPAEVRDEMSAYGLPADEYPDNDHWPYALYVREARRMAGESVLTQAHVLGAGRATDSVGIGSHWVDSHHVQRVVVDRSSFRGEGRVWHPVTRGYQLPYSLMLPRREECTNLLVPVCVSASRVAFCSIRVEAQWMALGEAAGAAAALVNGAPVQELDTDALRARLTATGTRLE